MADDPSQPNPSTTSARRWKGVLAVTLAGAVLWIAATGSWQTNAKTALEALHALGYWGPLAFILLYIFATVLLIPGSALTLGAGAVFGIGAGCVYVSIGSTLGAVAAFLIGRHTAREMVLRRLGNQPHFRAIDRAVGRDAWRIVLLTRLSPVLPFTFLNYAFSLTSVPFRTYTVASWIGMIPGTILYVYIGSLARTATQTQTRSALEWAFYVTGFAATMAVTILITRTARRALEEDLNP